MIEEILPKSEKKFECTTCGWSEKRDYSKDETAVFDAVECPKCHGIAKMHKKNINDQYYEQHAIDM